MPESPSLSSPSSVVALRRVAHVHPVRNPGVSFDLAWLDGLRVNQSAVERRTATLGTRRTVKKDAQAAWLLKAVTCIDLTTLNGDDTEGRVRRLCTKAKQPVRADLLAALGVPPHSITTGAVCVYHRYVAAAVDEMTECRVVLLEPGTRGLIVLRCGTVLHR